MKKMIQVEDLCTLEKMVFDCAKGALRHARLGCEWMKDWSSDKAKSEMADITVLKLMRCYSNSEFALKDTASTGGTYIRQNKSIEANLSRREKYEEYIEHNFRQCVDQYLSDSCVDQQHFDLILPVAFFSLVLQNESNADSVSRRAGKIDAEGIDSTPWKYRNPFKLKPVKIDYNSGDEKRFREAVSSLELCVARYTHVGYPIFSEKISNALQCTLRMEDQYWKIKCIAEHARIGVFLYDILKATHDERRPLNTILRIYMVMELHKTFDWTRMILSYSPDDELQLLRKGMLLRFFLGVDATSAKYLKDLTIPLYCKENDIKAAIKNHLKQKIQVREQYIKHYPFLHDSFDWEVDRFIEYYLNPNELRKYIGIDKEMLAYTKAMKSLIAIIPKFNITNDVGDKILKLDQIFSEVYYDNTFLDPSERKLL